ncbi:3-phosphoserine/phosphohydroxythreonine transaminase [Bacteroidia bacterium]|nr:3-phosphoserine/phosphohydroxythreonine transaminase [Bacteroidia bacterium]MDC0468120.1 3-phosphoserine/phosphohydroxythreonine transaminase [Bacteroidia bacterium]MDC0561620.1 3-phosphoserine/phosphohydroxythreonine transaminase [Bacteroidia bacterium]MDC3406562.1 3-phosphoserine/phosphohydroxythreonine transaminase [Bacteroidia bacterium]
MKQIHNFSAGPAILPQEVIQNCSDALQNFSGTNLSLIEVSHRSKEFVNVMDEAQSLVKKLMNIGDDYEVMYLQGGASSQFLMVAMNLLENKAAYLNTGTWSTKAIKEAKHYGAINELASSADKNFNYIPKDYTIGSDNDYFHCTSNNTIFGTQMQNFPDSPVPMICDMSSDIFSRKIDFSAFSLIYAGAQKNMGPAGTTLVVVKKEILNQVSRHIPTMLDYNTHINKGSMFNTPSVFAVYGCLQTLKWIDGQGLEEIENYNNLKADLIYSEIDQNDMFEGTTAVEDRSIMNATFVLKEERLNDAFLNACNEANISGLKGHRSVGGFRASMYNAMRIESVKVLVDVMRNFK